MKINGIDEEAILIQAQKIFKDSFIKIEEDHVFLKDVEKGCYQSDWLDHKFYVNTNYAYEDVLVKDNQTRYLVNAQTIWVKDNPFDIIYDIENHYYFVIEDETGIQFLEPNDYYERVKKSLKQIKEA
ncbi:MAG: hypothetical protein RSE52_01745 [Erysipelotrichaceae bacterium]